MPVIRQKWATAAVAIGAAMMFAAVQPTWAQTTPPASQPAMENSNNSDQPVTDTWITTKVKSELATTKGVSSTDISVTTVDGVVTLTGTQDNKIAVNKAIAVAKAVKGVKDVDHSALKAKG